MKHSVIFCMLLISHFSQGQKLDPTLDFVKNFFNDMREGRDVRKYLSDNFIVQNDIAHTDWQADYYLIKKFELQHIDAMTIRVKIDHGNGAFCTQFDVYITEENNKFKILPTEVKYEPKISRHIVIPWRNVTKLC